nr:Mas-related G-protein coupled receptor member D [Lysinibacillus timonensis]
MEQLLIIVSMLALGLSLCLFITGILYDGLNNAFKNKYTKIAGILFLAYIITFVPYIIIAN